MLPFSHLLPLLASAAALYLLLLLAFPFVRASLLASCGAATLRAGVASSHFMGAISRSGQAVAGGGHFPRMRLHSIAALRRTVGMLGLLAVTLAPAYAQSFTTTGALNVARTRHTATLLGNGKVLIAGGLDRWFNSTASVELYNPTTGTFTSTGALNGRLYAHTATLLGNGKVLIAGGFGSSSAPTTSAQLYDPTTGTFADTGALNARRNSHTATLLGDGQVLIAGGIGLGLLSSAELYNPTTGTFTSTGALSRGRESHTATLLANGQVLIAGGNDSSFSYTASVELYNPTTGTFTTTGALNVARTRHTATLLGNGKVLIAGGVDSSSNALASAQLYDPTTGQFTATGNLNVARQGLTATLLGNGKVLIAGGYNSSDLVASAQLYDPTTGAFTTTGTLNVARSLPTATLLGNGQVLLGAGAGSSGALASAELYYLSPANRAPVVSQVTLSNYSPKTLDTLTATYTASDPDGDTLTPSYVWKNGTTVLTNETAATLNLATVGNGDRGNQISCTITVTDTSGVTGGATSPEATVVTSAPVIATNSGLTVAQNAAQTVITNARLKATDADDDTLTYTLSAVPSRGLLKKGAATLAVGGTFTQADIDGSALSFTPNLGAQRGADGFTFSVSDGQGGNTSATTFAITITEAGSLTVTRTDDVTADDAKTSLREAVAFAATLTGTPNIIFDSTVFASAQTITLTQGEVVLDHNVIITGRAGSNGVSVSGNNVSRVFRVATGIAATVKDLSLIGGKSSGVTVATSGGAIVNEGTLVLSGCTLSGNNSSNGGAIVNKRNLTIINCTLAGNTATTYGGALFNDTGATAVISNSTIAGNSAGAGGGLVISPGAGTTVTVSNTIVANNTGGTRPDVMNSFVSGGYNLIGKVDGGNGFSATGDQKGTIAAPLDAGLNALGSYGGPTATMSLKASSPALDKGDPNFDTTSRPFDQRGIYVLRVRNGRLDIGAFEVQNEAPVAAADSYTAIEDIPLVVSPNGVLANDSDVNNGATLSITGNSAPTNGTLVLNQTTGGFTYTPATNFNGSDSFTYALSDGFYSATGTVTIAVTAVNDAPTINTPLAQTVAEDSGSHTVTLSGISKGATNESGQTLTLSATSSNTALIGNPTISGYSPATGQATLSYSSKLNANGSATITLNVSDDGGTANGGKDTTSPAPTFLLTMMAVDDAPVAVGDSLSTAEDTALDGTLSASDVDAGDTLTYIKASNPAHGSVTVNSDGSFTYTPRTNYNGPDSFTFKANDGTVDSNFATISITITPVNDAPVAVNDSYGTAFNTSMSVNAANGVLANDTDIESNALTVADGNTSTPTIDPVTAPQHGTLVLKADGSFTYTPASLYSGEDTFTYKASDGQSVNSLSNIATVTLTVASNVPPVAVDDSSSTIEDTFVDINVVGNDTDADGDTLVVAPDSIGNVKGGSAQLQADGKTVRFTPDANANDGNLAGGFGFTYKVSDGTSTSLNTATVTVNVSAANDGPVLTAVVIAPSTPKTNDTLTATPTATDADGDTLSYSYKWKKNGTLIPNQTGQNLDLSTVGHGDEGDTIAVAITADDGHGGTASKESLAVTIRGSAPTGITLSSNTVMENQSVGTTVGIFSTTDADPNDTFTYALVAGDGDSDNAAFTLSGAQLLTGSSFDFESKKLYSVRVKSTDANDLSVEATFTISVTNVNEAPTVTVTLSPSLATTNTVLQATATGADVDGDEVSFSYLWKKNDNVLVGETTSTLDLGKIGNGDAGDTIKVEVTGDDGQGGTSPQASATVTIQDSPSTALTISQHSVTENVTIGTAIGTFSTTDADPGDTFTYALVAGEGDADNASFKISGNTLLTDSPLDYESKSSYSIRVKSTDANGLSVESIFPISVLNVNEAPTATVRLSPSSPTTNAVLRATAIGRDPEGVGVVFSYVWKKNDVVLTGETTSSLDLSVVGNGDKGERISVTVVPKDRDLSGPSVSASTTVINSAPVLVAKSFSGRENQALSSQVVGSDADKDALTYSVFAAPRYGTLALQSSGAFTYTPRTNWNGTDSFSARVMDGSGANATAVFTLNIAPLNGVPVTVADVVKGYEDVPLTILASTLLKNDTNGENAGEVDALKIVRVGVPAGFPGTLAFDVVKQTILFTPRLNWNGTTTFSYAVQDSAGATATGQVTLQIVPVNDAPVAQSSSFIVRENLSLSGQVRGTDVEGDALTFALSTTLALRSGTLVFNSNGSFVYTPKPLWNGSDSFTFRAFDPQRAASAPVKISLTVLPVNGTPVAVSDIVKTPEDQALSIPTSTLISNDKNGEAVGEKDALRVIGVSVPTGFPGKVVFDGVNGLIVFTPKLNWNGTTSFTYFLEDSGRLRSSATVTVQVAPVNDAPSAQNVSGSVQSGVSLSLPLVATDVDGEALYLALSTVPKNGTASVSLVNGQWRLTYRSRAGFSGTETFSFVAKDRVSTSPPATITLTVNAATSASPSASSS